MSAPPPSAEEEPGTERVLVVRLSHLGDVVHALPVYHALRRALPTARFAWCLQSEFAELLRFLPDCEAWLPFDRTGGLAAWPRLRRDLRAFGPTWAVDCQGNWKSALATRLSGARRRSGPADADWREPSARRLVHDRPATPSTGAHAVDRMLHLARHLVPGAWSEAETPTDLRTAGAFDLGLPTAAELEAAPPTDRALADLASSVLEARRDAAERLGGPAGASSTGRPVLLALGRPSDPRTWPEARARELVRLLAAAGRRVLVLSGPAEADAGAELEAALGPLPTVTHLVGQRGLPRLAALFQGAASVGALYVGSDSGPMHLAWAMGLDVLCLAGPQDPARTGPWPPPGPDSPHRVLTAPGTLDCRPCLSRRCENGRGPVCLTELAPALVAEAVLSS